MAQAVDTVSIDVDLADVTAYPVLDTVGRIYEVAINGVGYMLDDAPDQPEGHAYDRVTVGLDPQRFATGDTPFAQAIERYSFSSLADQSGGAGQRWMDRDDTDAKQYEESVGLDPFTEEGRVELLHTSEQLLSSAYATPRAVVVDDTIYVQTGDAQLQYSLTGSGWTTLSGITDTTGAVAISSLTSDGEQWYAATGRSVIRGTTTNPGVDWSAVDAVEVQFAAGRICAAVKDTGSATPNRFTTLSDAGAEEKTNGHYVFPDGHTIVLGGVSQGFYFFGVYAGTKGAVWAWRLGLDESGGYYTPFEAWPLPEGMIPSAVGVAGGSVWVRAYQPEGSSAGQGSLWRLVVPGTGGLTPFWICDIEPASGSVDMSVGSFASQLNNLYFSWPTMEAGKSGIGCVSMKTGGWAKWIKATTTGHVYSIAIHNGRPIYTIGASGLWAENQSAYETTGTITMSISDGASALDKVWDEVIIVCLPLASGEEISVQYSADQGESWSPVGSIDTVDAIKQVWELAQKVATLQLRAVLTGDGTSTPTLSLLQARYHPLGVADTILTLPVDCSDNRTGLNGAPLPQTPNEGALKARELEALTQTRAQVQDVDWHLTGNVDTYEVLQARAKPQMIYDRSKAAKGLRTVVVLTMRKVGVS